MSERLKVLFVCARNRWRSPTAEQTYRNDSRLEVRSAGVSKSARRQIAERDLEWADLVVVMEQEHAKRIRERFQSADLPEIELLEIPDEYQSGDAELVELIRAGTESVLRDW